MKSEKPTFETALKSIDAIKAFIDYLEFSHRINYSGFRVEFRICNDSVSDCIVYIKELKFPINLANGGRWKPG